MEFRALIETELIADARARSDGTASNGGFLSPAAILLLCLVIGLTFSFVVKADDSSRINRVKTAFILNIARFVSWPAEVLADGSAEISLCLYRNNPIQQAIESIAGEEVSGRRIVIKQLHSLTKNDACNILLIGQDELQAYLSETQPDPNRPVLTIADLTDTDSHTHRHDGILVTLIRNGARIGFEINLQKTREVGLRMSSELLKLAIIVGDDP